MKNNRNPRPGFTLIELLVVIAIISLLVSILIPSLNKARELAKKAVCASNMRNIGLASNIYSNEYDGDFPSVNGNTYGYTADVWAMGIYTWATGGQDDVWMGAYPELAIPNEDRVLYKFADGVEIWKCPSDDSRNSFWSNLGAPRPEFYHVYGSSYGFNGNCMGRDHTPDRTNTDEGLWGHCRSDISDSSMVIEYFEFCCTSTDVGIRAHNTEEWYCNFLFVDGHVDYLLMEPNINVYLGGENGFTFKANR